jgi:hypothetical protein
VQGDWGNPTDQQIQDVLNTRGKSPLKVDDIKALAAKYNVPVGLVLGHLGQESGWGTDEGTLKENHNFLGLTGKGTKGSVRVEGVDRDFAAFGSDYEGLEAGIANMASSQYQGLSLQEYLSLYLTGSKDGTDDGYGNNVSDYIKTVLGIVNGKFGGNAGSKSVPISPAGGNAGKPTGQAKLSFANPGDLDLPAMRAAGAVGGAGAAGASAGGDFFGTVAIIIDNKVDGTKDTRFVRLGRASTGPFANVVNAPMGNGGVI